MSEVHVITYEVVGAGREIARKFFADCDAKKAARWGVVEKLGGAGFRPGHDGSIRSVLFKDQVPQGWRKVGRDKGCIECRPHMGTKAGKGIAAAISVAPIVPSNRALPDKFGWNGRSPIDGRTLYYGTSMRVQRPVERFFIRLPRTANDRWKLPDALVEVRESEFMRAIEDHNAAADKAKAAQE